MGERSVPGRGAGRGGAREGLGRQRERRTGIKRVRERAKEKQRGSGRIGCQEHLRGISEKRNPFGKISAPGGIAEYHLQKHPSQICGGELE